MMNDLEYGYNTDGVQNFIAAIRANALNEASEAVRNTEKIVAACENNWQGQARVNYVNNLRQDAEYVANQFERLYNILVSEIQQISVAMQNRDGSLIQEDNTAARSTRRNNFNDYFN